MRSATAHRAPAQQHARPGPPARVADAIEDVAEAAERVAVDRLELGWLELREALARSLRQALARSGRALLLGPVAALCAVLAWLALCAAGVSALEARLGWPLSWLVLCLVHAAAAIALGEAARRSFRRGAGR